MQFAADENFNGLLLRGLMSKLPDLDIVRVQDTIMYAASDPDLLGWLAKERRILLTHDADTMAGFAYDRVAKGLPMPGVIVVREIVTPGQLIDDLAVHCSAGFPSDFENLVVYIP